MGSEVVWGLYVSHAYLLLFIFTGVCSRRVADSVFSSERDTRQLLGKLAEKI